MTAPRLLRLELRRGPMPWAMSVAVVLFWLVTYRKTMALPPLWAPRAMSMQGSALAVFAAPVAGGAAWAGSREGRRRVADLVAVTAAPRLARQLAAWSAAACWAVAVFAGCVGVLYGVTARQAAWGGPLWWPAAVGLAGVVATSALGFAAGALWPGRFTAPLAAIAAFFGLALSTEPVHGSQSALQVFPVTAGPWDLGPDPGVATFYHYLPDLALAQILFLAGLAVAGMAGLGLLPGAGGPWLRRSAAAAAAAGLVAAGAGIALAGTGRLDARGMLAIPALHDAASDRPARYAPVCGRAAIPVCLNPAYAGYLPAVTAALAPVLGEVAGLPGAPARVSQAAATYRQESGNGVAIILTGPRLAGTPPVFRLLLPDQLGGPALTPGQLAAQTGESTGPAIVASVIGGGSPAQAAVTTALLRAAREDQPSPPSGRGRVMILGRPGAGAPPVDQIARPGTAAWAAALRFAARPAAVRRAWLARHLPALRAGRISLAQLP
jgi:hypothetical protein